MSQAAAGHPVPLPHEVCLTNLRHRHDDPAAIDPKRLFTGIDRAGAQTGSLQPQAIPIDLKIVLIGEPGVYEQLAAEDPQFPQVFKIHAEFDSTIPVNKRGLTRYADYLQWLVEGEDLVPLSDSVGWLRSRAVGALGLRVDHPFDFRFDQGTRDLPQWLGRNSPGRRPE